MGSHDLVAFADPPHQRAGKHDTQDLKRDKRRRDTWGEVKYAFFRETLWKRKPCATLPLWRRSQELLLQSTGCFSWSHPPELLHNPGSQQDSTFVIALIRLLYVWNAQKRHLKRPCLEWPFCDFPFTRCGLLWLSGTQCFFSAYLQVDFVAVFHGSLSTARCDVLAAGVRDRDLIIVEVHPVRSVRSTTAMQLHTHKHTHTTRCCWMPQMMQGLKTLGGCGITGK